MAKLFRVYYEETLEYEDYVEAESEEEAKEIFANTLEVDDDFEPIKMEVVEFEAEEVDDSHYTGHQSKLPCGLF